MAIAIYGHPAVAKRRLEDYPAFSPGLGSEGYEIYHKGKDEVLAGMNKPTIADIERDIDRKDGWIKNFDIDEEIKKLTDRYSVETSIAPETHEAVTE